jgi:Cell Wall Hydrolase
VTAIFTPPVEPRPRDFRARLARRHMHGIAASRGHAQAGRRLAVLLAAVAVPAFAAPGGIPDLAIGRAEPAPMAVEPMPFETPGDSFPGSAFYYLIASDQVAAPDAVLGEGIHSDAEPAPGLVGPAARALAIGSYGIDRTRAEQCLTAAIYYEAATEPDAGQRAVAQVVLNRVAHRAYPDTVCGVVYQGSERSTGCQFSFTCDGSLARAPMRLFWDRAARVARAALAGDVYAPVGLATHYHTIAVSPYWAPSLALLGTIGAHRFYKFSGAAGREPAFRFAYAGGEPLAAPHPRSAAADAQAVAVLDPPALQRAYEQAFPLGANATTPGQAPERNVLPSPLPASPVDNLPQAAGIRPEYAGSGRWIAQPGN